MRQEGNQAPLRYELRGFRKDGSMIYLDVTTTTIPYGGEPAQLSYLRDITERKVSEIALRQSEEQHRNIIREYRGRLLRGRSCRKPRFLQ